MTTLIVRHKVGDIVTNQGNSYRIISCNDEYVTEVLVLNTTRKYSYQWPHATFQKTKPKLTHKEEICNKIKELEQKFKDRQEAKKKEIKIIADEWYVDVETQAELTLFSNGGGGGTGSIPRLPDWRVDLGSNGMDLYEQYIINALRSGRDR
jgi:RNA-binding protein YlmH